MADKSLEWLGSSKDDFMDFPEETKDEAGFDLRRVQQGLMPRDFKPMFDVGHGVYEIRITTEFGGRLEHRVLYTAKLSETVYVLHAFEKHTQKTPAADKELARKRLAELLRSRKK